MNKSCIFVFAICCFVSVIAQTNTNNNNNKDKGTPQKFYGSAVDEIIVEQSLNVRKKPQPTRKTRSIVAVQGRLYRVKRQRGGGFGGFGGLNNDYSSSSALANANSQGQHFGPNGFGGSAGSAQGQAFNSQGPLGGFGAAASGSQTQGFNVGPDGFRGSAGLSGSQSYNLPNGHTINLSYTNGYSVGPDGNPAISNGNSIAYT